MSDTECRSTRHRALLAIVGAALLFSTGGVAIKGIGIEPSGAAPLWIAAGRSLVAALVLLLLVPSARKLDTRVLRVAFSYGATLVLYVVANRMTTATNAIALQSTAPLHMLVVGPIIYGELLRRRDFVSATCVAIGTTLILFANEPVTGVASNPPLGNWLALASGFTWALTLGGLRSLALAGASPLAGTVAGNLCVVVCLAPFLPAIDVPDARAFALVGYLGAFQVALAYVFLTFGLRHLRAWTASVVLLIEPVANPVWTGLAHGEWPAPLAIAGGVVLFGGATWAVAPRGRGQGGDGGG